MLSLTLGECLRQDDDEALLRFVEAHPKQDEVFDALSALVPRHLYRVGGHTHFSELFFIPVLAADWAESAAERGARQAWEAVLSQILDEWLEGTEYDYKVAFSGVLRYDLLSVMRPSVVRQYLYKAAPGAARLEPQRVERTDVQLPDHMPRLGFIPFVLTRRQGWPSLPGVNPYRDGRLKQVLGGALTTSATLESPAVMRPATMAQAVVNAVVSWLQVIHQSVGIQGWSTSVVRHSADVVRITLILDHQQVPFTQFMVRRHQSGAGGLQQVFMSLRGLAPFVDQPNDAPSAAQALDGPSLGQYAGR